MVLNINRKYIAYLGELPSIMLYSALQPHIESNVFSLLLPFFKGRIEFFLILCIISISHTETISLSVIFHCMYKVSSKI